MNDEEATPRRRLDWYAVVSYVFAVVWLFGIGSVIALYVGRRSLRRMKIHQELRGRTVAWAGIALATFGIGLAVLSLGLSVTA
jgi:hypothetical protein